MDSNGDLSDISRLTFAGDFHQQVEEIMQYVRLTRQEVETLQLLFNDLHQSLSIVWPGCKVHGFGSIVTGLGIKTSDIDCYVELPSWFYPPDRPFVIQARNILRQRPQIYQELFSLINAKIPLVKFYHKPTRRFCDVNFTSMAGVCNSALINYFLSDRKILYLAILVKYWAKIHNLTGLNMMSNYCLTLLVVFYLQQKNILPSVMHLQEKIDEHFVDCWNAAFCKEYQFSQINETLYQLLGGFFKYYSTFNFEKLIISPYVGKPVERDLFLKVESVPLEFQLYKINVSSSNSECKPIRLDTCMCVQDPFEHNRNCAVSVHPRLAQDIISHFRKASEIFDSMDEKSFLRQLLLKIGSNKPRNRQRKKPAVLNRVKKKYKQNLNIQQNVKYIVQKYFKVKNERR